MLAGNSPRGAQGAGSYCTATAAGLRDRAASNGYRTAASGYRTAAGAVYNHPVRVH